MDTQEKYFELLLSEKQLVDSIIGGYSDLNLKVFGSLGVAGVLVGVFSNAALQMTPAIGVACLAVTIAICGVTVQGALTYSLTMGYIYYKNSHLNREFRDILGHKRLPIATVRIWAKGAARKPTIASIAFLSVLHKIVGVVLLIVATHALRQQAWGYAGVGIGWAVLAGATVCEIIMMRATLVVLSPESYPEGE